MVQTITAVIPAKNEEKNITRCIKSLDFCNGLIVMWMGNDNTGKIAEKLGAKVVRLNQSKKDDFVGVQKNINWAIDNSTTDWILRIDADEVVTSHLKEKILQILSQTSNLVAYGIPRKQFFLGTFLEGGDWAYDRLVRLFRRGYAYYDPIVPVHEQFKVKGKIGFLKSPLLHYSHPTIADVHRKFESYTNIQSRTLKDSFALALIKMLTLPPYIFLRWTVWHLGIRDGWRGIQAGFLRSWYEFILYKKYIQRSFF